MTAQAKHTVRLSELTAGEARPLLAQNPVILLPLGSQEDQGPHSPMGDYLCAARVAELIAEKANADGVPTLVAPVLPFGGADHFGTMPGGIALSQSTLVAVLRDMLSCLLRHGLTKLIVINGHGGNVQAIHQATQEAYLAKGVLVPSLYLWQIGYGLLPKLLGAETAAKVAGHGGDPLSSVAMHLFPELVRKDMVPGPSPKQKVMGLDVTGFGTIGFEGVNIQAPLELDEIAPNGVFNADPRLCSDETGKRLTEELVRIGSSFVAHYAAHSPKHKKAS